MRTIDDQPLICLREPALAESRGSRSRTVPHLMRRQQGTIAIMSFAILTVMLGFCGLALDLSRTYNRKVEMQKVAEAVALAAARELNGTTDGVAAALVAAANITANFHYQYEKIPVTWSDQAIRFSRSPARNGNWVDPDTAKASAGQLFYVRVDTNQLDAAHRSLDMIFMPALSESLRTVSISGSAVAGRTTIDAMPLAICAMSLIPAAQRSNSGGFNELVEYGFRRGVSYDLMQLNPGPGAAANFLINPLAPPATPGSAADLTADVAGPYVCAGNMSMPRLGGDPVRVTQPFPLASLFVQLNSRFDNESFTGGQCNFRAAPPDRNIRAYTVASVSWMTTATTQAAGPAATVGKMETVADIAPPGGPASQYGLLWAYAKAVPFTAYTPGIAEPSTGYTPFATTNAVWASLYNLQKPNGYTASPPYKASFGSNFASPSAAHGPGVNDRRVLRVPLLSCPVAAGANVPATVLAIGKFFMTIPATATTINAEFAGAVRVQSVRGQVELFP
ncbi:MAG: pilus assembly protein TadG-related protein [Massilia sp.]